MKHGSSLSTLSSTQRPQLCLWPSLNRWDSLRDVFINSLIIFWYLIISYKICKFQAIMLHPASLCCRTWVQKTAWNGRSCTSLDRDRSSPALWCCPCRSCMLSTRRLFSSSSRSESSTTQPLTTRPWQSLLPWQPHSLLPLRSDHTFHRRKWTTETEEEC